MLNNSKTKIDFKEKFTHDRWKTNLYNILLNGIRRRFGELPFNGDVNDFCRGGSNPYQPWIEKVVQYLESIGCETRVQLKSQKFGSKNKKVWFAFARHGLGFKDGSVYWVGLPYELAWSFVLANKLPGSEEQVYLVKYHETHMWEKDNKYKPDFDDDKAYFFGSSCPDKKKFKI